MPLQALVLWAVFVMLLLTATGVFRLNLNFNWSSGITAPGASSALFEFGIQKENILNPLAVRNQGLDVNFWGVQAVILCLTVIMPFLRLVAGSVLALCSATLVLLVGYYGDPRSSSIPMEFGMMSTFVLYSAFVALNFFAEMRDKYKLTKLFSQFVPPELVKQYSFDPTSLRLEGEAREVTVLFCDIRGFTSVSERLAPDMLAQWLNDYFDLVSGIIVDKNGTIDKYMGDSVMAMWGAPIDSHTHALDAVSAALEIVREIDKFNAKLKSGNRPLPEFSVGIGISTGSCNVGIMGSKYRRTYTVVGDTVNIAQRLETLTKEYKVPIIVSDATARLSRQMLYRELGRTRVKGRKRYVSISQPIEWRSRASKALKQQVRLHNKGVNLYNKRQWYQAQATFEKLQQDASDGSVYEHFLRHIQGRKSREPLLTTPSSRLDSESSNEARVVELR